MPKILVSAGESSGDERAAALIGELREIVPDLDVFGMGGAALAGAGCRLTVDIDRARTDVIGFVGVLRRLPEFFRIMKKMVEAAEREKPDLALLVDYPGFNWRLAARLKRRGVRAVYYVSPQVWAWAPSRTRKMGRLVEKMLVLFPFERDIYESAGVPAEFVGHPLADELPGDYPEKAAALRRELGIADGEEILALLPGSRPMEFERHLEPFAAAARRIREARPSVRPILALAAGADTGRLAADAGRIAGFSIPVVAGRSREVVAAAELALVVSGTATLECALLGCPMLVCYRAAWINYALGRLLVTIPCIALANVVAGRPTVPELWQGEVTPARIAETALAVLDDEAGRGRMRQALAALRDKLGVRGASRRAAQAVAAVLRGGGGGDKA